MKKIYRIIALACCCMIVLQACKKDEEDVIVPSLQTAVIANITETTASATAKIVTSGSSAITECGVCWSTVANPTVENQKVTAGQGTGEFTVQITGLKSGTTYYVRSYAITASGVTYGDQRSFTTEGQLSLLLPFAERFIGLENFPPFWKTLDYDGDGYTWELNSSSRIAVGEGVMSDSEDDLTPFNFLISPKITISGTQPKLEWSVGSSAGGAAYVPEHYKVVVSETPFTNQNCTTVGTVVFEETLPSTTSRILVARSANLAPFIGKDVYIAWVHYNCTDKYLLILTDISIGSNENPVTTSRPLLSAVTASNVTNTGARVEAQITGDGGRSVFRRGFCYGTSANPTVNDIVITNSVSYPTCFTPFSANLSLSPGNTYYVRAFAENALGVAYGDQQTVVTPDVMKTLLFSENFDVNPFTASGSQWVLIDKDGDGRNFEFFNDGDDQCARSRSWLSGVGALTPENYMVLPPVTIPADALMAELTFTVAAAGNSDYAEKYAVLLSLAPVDIDSCRDGQIIKPLETLTAAERSWTFTPRKVNLSAFKGQKVYISFVHKDCTDQASLLIGDIEVASFK